MIKVSNYMKISLLKLRLLPRFNQMQSTTRVMMVIVELRSPRVEGAELVDSCVIFHLVV